MDRLFGFEAIPGIAARFYAWATEKRAIVRDLFSSVEEETVSLASAPAILDLGCGPGALALRLARRCPDRAVIGVDLSPAMVRMARARAAREGLAERVRFLEGNAAALPLDDGAFDLVVSTLSLHHWRDRAAALREIHRVLKPGGRAWIWDIRKDTTPETEREARRRYGGMAAFLFLRLVRLHSFVTDAEVRALLQEAGSSFRHCRSEDEGLFVRIVLETLSPAE
jgi:ubiquinone/menaquinone biosynthesis C-methylase UbiE